MLREIKTHKVNGVNDGLDVVTTDEPGPGGAHHAYKCSYLCHSGPCKGAVNVIEINFQNGPIAEVGTNGLTHEAVLAIVADRLQSFQKGTYACRENALALTKIEEALHWMHHRTRERRARNVEGTMNK